MDLVAKGKIQLKDIITHRYSFKDARAAFEAMKNGAGYDGKPPIKCKLQHVFIKTLLSLTTLALLQASLLDPRCKV